MCCVSVQVPDLENTCCLWVALFNSGKWLSAETGSLKTTQTTSTLIVPPLCIQPLVRMKPIEGPFKLLSRLCWSLTVLMWICHSLYLNAFYSVSMQFFNSNYNREGHERSWSAKESCLVSLKSIPLIVWIMNHMFLQRSRVWCWFRECLWGLHM